MGPRGKQIAKYPGAATLARVTGLALKWGKRPSVVWRDVKRHKKDYFLIFAYMEWEYQEQEKALEDAKNKGKTKRRR